MGTDTDTVLMGTATEECWSMSMIAWVVAPCKLFVTTVSVGAAQVVTQGTANVGKTSTPSTTTTGTIGKARVSIPTNPAIVMLIAKTLTVPILVPVRTATKEMVLNAWTLTSAKTNPVAIIRIVLIFQALTNAYATKVTK